MAEEKITIVDLRRAIAKQTNTEEALVGNFLTQLISAIKEGLKKDKQVRISGLGTFKLQWVEPRKSVNISTGEPIVIEGYQKLSFTPEPSVKERINEPYADLVPVQLDAEGNPLPDQPQELKQDPMTKFDEQALEIKDLLADLGADLGTDAPVAEAPAEVVPEVAPIEEITATEVPADSPAPAEEDNEIDKAILAAEATVAAVREIPKEPLPEDEEAPAEVTVQPEVDAPAEETPAAEEVPVEAPVAEAETPAAETEAPAAETAAAAPAEEVPVKEKKPRKPFRGWLVALITIIVILLLLAAGALFLQHKIEIWADMLNGKAGGKELPTVTQEPLALPADTFITDSLQQDSLAAPADEEVAPAAASAQAGETAPKQDFYKERNYTEFIGMETVKEGSRLTWIARKYYGSKDHWVFIYEANKEKIKNPGNVGIGTQLRIPKLPDEILDPDNQKAQHFIKELQDKYLNTK